MWEVFTHSPGVPKLALICSSHTTVKMVSRREPGVRSMLCSVLEVLQQAQDALLLRLSELRAPTIPNVLCVLWGKRTGELGWTMDVVPGVVAFHTVPKSQRATVSLRLESH